MDKILRLYIYVDGGANDTPFPSADNPIEIGAFRYDAKRMGGAPTITASVNYASCLDDEWTYDVYAMFNGERYYLKQIPTSSYNNTSAMYKHDIELVSERVALDNVYFFDVVSDDIVDDDKPVSNSTKVVFFGDVREFANRLKASLQYSALDYDVVVDANVVSEEKLVSFEDQFFSNVLQEIYNTYEVPYYFEGKTIHIGFSKLLSEDEELPVFSYGVDDALISITKNNANYKIVNRATGIGSSENIPYYYPNKSPKGEIELTVDSSAVCVVANKDKFANNMDIDEVITYNAGGQSSLSVAKGSYDGVTFTQQDSYAISLQNMKPQNMWFLVPLYVTKKGRTIIGGGFNISDRGYYDMSQFVKSAELYYKNETLEIKDGVVDCGILDVGSYTVKIGFSFGYLGTNSYEITPAFSTSASDMGWVRSDGKVVNLEDLGIKIVARTPSGGDTLKQTLIRYIKTSTNLLPPIYRETYGEERFYNATRYPFEYEEGYELKSNEYVLNGFVHNDSYKNEDGEYIEFNNPFIEGRPKEHIITVEDIKPSIEGMLVNGQRIDMFEAFAYDEDDNDETYQDDDGNVYFKHPYFFAKLKPLGFNLFDHAIEQQPMTISFTSGTCGACNFEIAVDEESQKNTVQVDDNGNLVYDENGRVLCGAEGSGQNEVQPQDVQQDTTSRSVWIALQKEEETYGIFMPKAPTNGVGGHRPSTEDTFVILGINLPDEYILNAERRLEAEIIKYLQDNNDEKFTFSIGFSRIYFAENEDVLNSLNENSKIQITYDNKTYDLYVSSFSYTMSESDALPEIKVELDETLKTSQNAIQKAINEVKTTLGSAINEVSQGVAMQRRSYVSKVQDDTAMGVVDFSKGVKFGEGGKVEILDNNSAKLTIEYLEVTKKATFTSLEIQEKTHVGGQMLVTPASMNCGEVEEFEGFYRCYFQTKGADGSEEIFNQFAVGDQAICQTFNAWGSKYYWRLVVGVGEDYIDLSKEDCDEGSGVPEAGDRIIQMGNRDNADRQNAIVIAAHGDNSPYIVQYKGINNFDLPKTDNDPRITTLLSPTKNILTGTVKMQAGSEGLENFEAWTQLKEEVDAKVSIEDISGYEYLVESLQQPTEVLGGLILTSNIQLRDSDGSIKSGINGIYMPNALGGGIAAWYGGVMEEGVANAIIRFDGSGYFAKGNLSWDNKGGASFADGKITITPQGALIFSDDIAFGSNENETVASIIQGLSTVLSYFTLDDAKTTLTSEYNLVIEGDVASGEEGEDTPASGIRGIYVNGVPYTDTDGDGFIDLGTISGGGGTADLSNYYTKGESDARYLLQSGGTIDGNLNIASKNTDTPLVVKGYTNTGAWIEFQNSVGNLGYIGYNSTKEPILYDKNGAARIIVHSGNIGSYKAGDSALFDGRTSGEYYLSQKNGIPNGDLANLGAGSYYAASAKGDINPLPIDYCSLSVLGQSYYSQQLCMYHNATRAWLRGIYNTSSGVSATDWHELAFTDSTVAAANKLATARTIWGQSFDGTGDVSGMPRFSPNTYSSSITTSSSSIVLSSKAASMNGYNTGIALAAIGGYDSKYQNHLHAWIGLGARTSTSGAELYPLVFATNNSTTTNTAPTERMRIMPNGNVLIGTTTDSGYKLDVAGTGSFYGVKYEPRTFVPSTTGWYRVYKSLIYSRGDNVRLNISRNYNNTPSGSYTFDIVIGYQTASITQINSAIHTSYRYLSNVRVIFDGNYAYIDVYISGNSNSWYVSGSGRGEFQSGVINTETANVFATLSPVANSMVVGGNLIVSGDVASA